MGSCHLYVIQTVYTNKICSVELSKVSPHPAIAVLHDRVPGRLRLHVPALYRNPNFQAWLADCLGTSAGIDRIQINTVTGNLVVTFDPTQDSAAILKLIQTYLASPQAMQAALSTRSAAVKPRLARFQGRFGRRHRPRSNTAIPPHARWHTYTPQEVLTMLGVRSKA